MCMFTSTLLSKKKGRMLYFILKRNKETKYLYLYFQNTFRGHRKSIYIKTKQKGVLPALVLLFFQRSAGKIFYFKMKQTNKVHTPPFALYVQKSIDKILYLEVKIKKYFPPSCTVLLRSKSKVLYFKTLQKNRSLGLIAGIYLRKPISKII